MSSGLLFFLLFICLPSGQSLKGSTLASKPLVDLPGRPGRVAGHVGRRFRPPEAPIARLSREERHKSADRTVQSGWVSGDYL